jgi:hypothetical protein
MKMTARQFVAVGFRLFAIWLCVGAFQVFGITESLKRASADWGDTSWLGLSLAGLFIGVALLVWALSGALARGLMFGLNNTEVARLSAFDLVAVGCVLMGLWWLKEALIPLISLWLKAVALSPETGQTAFAWLEVSGKVTAGKDLLQIGVAAFFISRPYQIAGWLIRNAPQSSQSQVGEE